MKTTRATLLAVFLSIIVTAPIFFSMAQQSPTNKVFSDSLTKRDVDAKISPLVPVALSPDDQKQLDLINDRLTQMKPQLEQAKKQQEEAQARLNEATTFISQYNQIDAIRMAFLFRVAADICGCKTSELEFSADGKSVLKRAKPQLKQ